MHLGHWLSSSIRFTSRSLLYVVLLRCLMRHGIEVQPIIVLLSQMQSPGTPPAVWTLAGNNARARYLLGCCHL